MKEQKKERDLFPPLNQSILSIQKYEKQIKCFDFLFSSGAFTMKQVSVKSNVDRANICRYVAKRKQNNTIYLVRFGICPITKHTGVGFYTTNKALYSSLTRGSNAK